MRHDWAPTESVTIISSKNCPHITAVKVVVSVQLFSGLQLAQKIAPENPHRTACHKFRPSVNLDEYDSLQGSSDPSNATGTTFSAVTRVCLIRAPVASYTWQYPPTAAGILVHEDTCRTLCLRLLQSVFVRLQKQKLTGISKFTKTLPVAQCLIHFLPTTCLSRLSYRQLSTINTSCHATRKRSIDQTVIGLYSGKVYNCFPYGLQ